MEDHNILELFRARSEDAIKETQNKYGKYCHTIAYNILRSEEDTEECINDCLTGLWNTIPPQNPQSLKGYIGKLIRNISINRYNYLKAQKRLIPQESMESIAEEFDKIIPDKGLATEDKIILKDAIDKFLAGLKTETRILFMRRYWYMYSIKEISEMMNITQSNVKIILLRTRNKMKEFLEKEGIIL